MFNFFKSIYRYFDKLSFFIYKLRQHILYSGSVVDLRDKNHKIREVAHSIDKSMTMKNSDPNRGERAKKNLKALCDKTEILAAENHLLIKRLSSMPETFGFDSQMELPTVRRFLNLDVETNKIESSVVCANKYPKSCSRESIKIYLARKDKSAVASCFSGFSCIEGPYEIAVVVVDLTAYDARSEVFAPYIDGSIFATGFCRSLWEKGIGSCMLNWSSQTKESEDKLRRKLNLAKNDLIIMGVVFGYPEFIPFHAPRKKVEDLII
ncbi:hypothetical protein J8L73_10310 [Pseudoalteromonas sp. MMG006]|uniref:nitroreductase family protein n=1 Tax=Pseudoalteromonas sp. MMG006 TaxID=2822683 RepID=UPI001B37CD40|nr:hypothetical protein [Pseudoalteromonas sp. MMG006]MBQ4799515.1 hypothetical protein [Pseudoalteromonas sp. MMG006]